MALSPRGSKAKGDSFERELAAHLTRLCGIPAFRAPLSGGGKVMSSGGADLTGTPGLFIEAKRVERVNIHEAMAQAVRNARETRSPELPIVITRRNRQALGESLAVMRLDDLLILYSSWLARQGFTKEAAHDASPPRDHDA